MDTVELVKTLDGMTEEKQLSFLKSEYHPVNGYGDVLGGPAYYLMRSLKLDQEFALPGRTRQESISILDKVRAHHSKRGVNNGKMMDRSRDRNWIFGSLTLFVIISGLVTGWPMMLFEASQSFLKNIL